jgi:hypothetical protein
MTDVRAREDHSGALEQRQRDALWKWRWLGLSESTPAFKASLLLLASVAFALATYVTVVGLP